MQFPYASPQPNNVQRVDGKHPVTALRASRSASQPGPSPTRSLGQRRIHNLYEFRIACRQPHAPSIAEIAPSTRWPTFHSCWPHAITTSRHPRRRRPVAGAPV
jgi:hypothetical protein